MKRLILFLCLFVGMTQAQTKDSTWLFYGGVKVDSGLTTGVQLRSPRIYVDSVFEHDGTFIGLMKWLGRETKQQVIDTLNALKPDTIGLTRPLTVNQWVGFNGPNSGSALIGTNDSVQVTVPGLKAGALIVASYNSNAPLTTSSIPVSVGSIQDNYFTIFADEGKTVTYWIMTGDFIPLGNLRTLFAGAGPYVMGDSVGFSYIPLPTDSLLIFQGHIHAVIAPDSGGFVGVLFGLQDGDDTDDSLTSVLWYNDTGGARTIDSTIQIVIPNQGDPGTLVFKPFTGYTASTDTITDVFFYASSTDTTITQPTPPPAEMAWSGVGFPAWNMQHTVVEIWGADGSFVSEEPSVNITTGSPSWTKVEDDSTIVTSGMFSWTEPTEEEYGPSITVDFYRLSNDDRPYGTLLTYGISAATNEGFVTHFWGGDYSANLQINGEVFTDVQLKVGVGFDNLGTLTNPRIAVARPLQKKQFVYTKAADDSLLVATFHVHGESPIVTPSSYFFIDRQFRSLGFILKLGDYKASHYLASTTVALDSMIQLRIDLDTMTVGRSDTVRLKFVAYDSTDVLNISLPYVTIIKKISDLLLDLERLPERFKSPLWRKGDFV